MWGEPVYSKDYLANVPKTSQGTPFGSVLFHHPPPPEYCAPPWQPVMNLEDFFPPPGSPVLSDLADGLLDYVSEGITNDSLRSDASVYRHHESPGAINHSSGSSYPPSLEKFYSRAPYASAAHPMTIARRQKTIQHHPRPPLGGPNTAGQAGRWYWIPDGSASAQIQKSAVYVTSGEHERVPVRALSIQHHPPPPLSGSNAAGQSGRWYWIPDYAASVQILKPGVYAGEYELLPVRALLSFS
jgi:hypothetical protein